ncbi:MAG: hypothetical protein KatS3mg057_0999 [Herpetosiphonaceae bacterium]|nr:MAG: hypothetical protein KatS3mg057_0999 [Herpetosiphonaceae bacterium]
MAELKLFTPEELAERRKPRRQQRREAKERTIEQFREQLERAGPGYGGEVVLEEGDDKRKTRGLLKEAATRAGLQLRFRPIKDPSRIEFSVVEGEEEQPTRRGGRGRQRAG